MSKSWIAALMALLLIGGIIYYNKVLHAPEQAKAPAAGAPPKDVSVEAIIARSGPVSDIITVSGTLLADEEVELRPETSGRIVLFNITEGQPVAQNALLVKLFDDDLEAQYNKARLQKEIYAKNQERLQNLVKVDGVSQLDYDQARNQVNNVQADMDYTRALIRKTEIRAPFSGKIGLRYVSPGALVTPTTLIANLIKTDVLKVDFNVPEKYGIKVHPGDVFSFTVDGYRDTFAGKVYAIESRIDAATRSIRVRAKVNNTKDRLLPGAFARIQLSTDIRQAIQLPTNAIVPKGRARSVILSRGGKAVYTEVTTGFRSEDSIQVLGGIQPGDTVVTTGILFVKPASGLKIKKINGKPIKAKGLSLKYIPIPIPLPSARAWQRGEIFRANSPAPSASKIPAQLYTLQVSCIAIHSYSLALSQI